MKRVLLLIAIFTFSLYAQEDNDIDMLLENMKVKTDLSEKTKLENGGISYIFTRSDLERMQARNLKDVLKSTYPFGYGENRYGLPDPSYNGTTLPFSSSSLRLYIDNQEISTGLYGSGIVTLGDIDIGFVDHIEVYSANPTYEFTTEPTFTIIRLYSKKADRDEGSKITITGANHGANSVSFYNSSELDNEWAYFAYVSQNNDKREKYSLDNTELSRDRAYTHIFGSFYDENNRILLDTTIQKRDSFVDQSIDATPTKAKIDYENYHIGYDGRHGFWKYQLSYERLHTATDFEDDVTPIPYPPFNSTYPIESFYTKSTSYVVNGELSYDFMFDEMKFTLGTKYRYKHFKNNELIANGFDIPRSGHDKQQVGSIFLEHQHYFKDNSVLTIGVNGMKVTNNHSVQDDNLFLCRLGHTYTTQNWVFKSVYTHNEITLDPFLVNSEGFYITPGKKEPQKQDIFIENIKYDIDNSEYELIISYIIAKNRLIPNKTGLLYSYEDDLHISSAALSWTYYYNDFDKLYLTSGINYIKDMPYIGDLKQYAVTMRNLNTYKKLDFFNELIFYYDDFSEEDYFDYSLGVTYHQTSDLSLSFKAINIFHDAKEEMYPRIDPNTLTPLQPFQASAIDRRFIVALEYTF